LPQIKVNCADAVTKPHKGCGNMHGDGGFARAALFVSDHDYMRHDLGPLSLIPHSTAFRAATESRAFDQGKLPLSCQCAKRKRRP